MIPDLGLYIVRNDFIFEIVMIQYGGIDYEMETLCSGSDRCGLFGSNADDHACQSGRGRDRCQQRF